RAENRPLVIDFTADWCTAGKEMEKTSFVDPRFWKAAEPFVALRLDGSDPDDPIYDASYKTYGLVGLPSVVVLDAKQQASTIFNGHKVEADELVPALDKASTSCRCEDDPSAYVCCR